MSLRPFAAVAVVALLVLSGAPAPVVGAHATSEPAGVEAPTADPPAPVPENDSAPRVVAAYPNPAADGDVGEFVLLRFPSPTRTGNWTLGDGETTISLGNRPREGYVLVAADVDAADRIRANATATLPAAATRNATTVRAPELALSNAGERLVLSNESGGTVSTLAYDDAPETAVVLQAGTRQLGATDHPAWTTRDVDARAFVLPDTEAPLAPIRRADDRVLLAGYTFASERVARALERAQARGVDVRVLVDDAPVGGISRRQVRVLDSLADAGVDVRALGGDRARYDYQHAKYLVADDAAVVLTENWKPSGTGARANRGWGVVLEDPAVAADLARVFESDWRAPDARPWRAVAADATVEPEAPANGSYRTATTPANVTVDAVTVVTAPDNAERELSDLLQNATERVRVLQMTAERDGVLLGEAIAAARRGVDVRVLLSSAWYAREENARVVDALNQLAEREDLPLEARLVAPGDAFRKVHAKGVVVDDRVVLGSVNWNDHSLRENREIAVVMAGDAVADYYADAFAADWERGHRDRVPTWLAAAAALAVLVLLGVLKRHVELADSG